MSYEQALIGTVLANPEAYLEVYDTQPSDFLDQSHNTIWFYITNLFEKGALSSRTVIEHLRADNKLDSLGDEVFGENYIEFLLTLQDTTGVKEFAHQVTESSVKRQLENIGRRLTIGATNEQSSDEIIEEHIKNILMLRRTHQKDPIPVGDLLPGFNEKMLKIASGELKPYWHPPIQAIKEVLYHMTDVDFQVIVGQPARGKSSMLRFDAIQTAMRGEKVLTLTLENSEDECLSWGMAHLSQVDHYHIVDQKKITNKERERYEESKEKIQALPWYIQEMGVCSTTDVLTKIKRFKLQHPDLRLVQVDGLYLVAGKGESVYENISHTSQSLRSLAQEIHVPIQSTTQFNRGVKHKNEPELSDILYAGENSARQVCAILSSDMNEGTARLFPENLNEEGKLISSGGRYNAVVMQVQVLKNTNGQVGKSGDIKWIKPTQTFQTLERDWNGGRKLSVSVVPKDNFNNRVQAEQLTYDNAHPKPQKKQKKTPWTTH